MKKHLLYLSGILILSVSLSSCVSKKKYDTLLRAKNLADRELTQLKKDKGELEKSLQQHKDDFNAVRYQLTANNAAKDKAIDALYTKLHQLESMQSNLKSELTNASDEIKYTTKSAEQKVKSLETSLKEISKQREELQKEYTETKRKLEWENRQLKTDYEFAKGRIDNANAETEKVKKELDNLNLKLEQVRQQKAESDAEIKKLTNQVNLLKKEVLK